MPISRPAVSRHLPVLNGAGLISASNLAPSVYTRSTSRISPQCGATSRLGSSSSPKTLGIEPLRITFEVDCSPDHAFAIWTLPRHLVVAAGAHVLA
jgi:hypothetical protein